MSLLTPERVPVKVYKWDDVGAPALDKTAGCVANILKSCLAVGYGAKESAGWTMPFGDTVAGIKVFRPEVSPEKDFYLKISADSGTQAQAQVYFNMMSVDTGDLRLQCDFPFKYAKANSTGKWLLIASSRSVWFFCEQRYSGDANKTGAYFFCGDTTKNSEGQRALWLNHTGGPYDDGYYSSLLEREANTHAFGKLYTIHNDVVMPITPISVLFNGEASVLTDTLLSSLYLIANKKLYTLPGIVVPSDGAIRNNFNTLNVSINSKNSEFMVFGTSGSKSSNYCVGTQVWEY